MAIEGTPDYPIDEGRPARRPEEMRTDPHAERNPDAARGIAVLTQLSEVAKASREGALHEEERTEVTRRLRHSLAALGIVLEQDSALMREVVFSHYGLHADEPPRTLVEIAEATGEDLAYVGTLVDHGATLVGAHFHE